MIEWINNNEGFLMVAITLVYVIATVFICIFNGKSASASRKQIEEAQKQQKQNAGIQLYGRRMEVVRKFSEKAYEEIRYDVPILFNNEINSSFLDFVEKQKELDSYEYNIQEFESELFCLVRRNIYDEIVLLRSNAANENDFAALKKKVLQCLDDTSEDKYGTSVDNYISWVRNSVKLHSKIIDNSVIFIEELKNYITKSIH